MIYRCKSLICFTYTLCITHILRVCFAYTYIVCTPVSKSWTAKITQLMNEIRIRNSSQAQIYRNIIIDMHQRNLQHIINTYLMSVQFSSIRCSNAWAKINLPRQLAPIHHRHIAVIVVLGLRRPAPFPAIPAISHFRLVSHTHTCTHYGPLPYFIPFAAAHYLTLLFDIVIKWIS